MHSFFYFFLFLAVAPKTSSSIQTAPESFSITNGHETSKVPAHPVPAMRALNHDHNIDQKLITVTEDKAFICLNRNIRQLGKKRWIHPLSLLISLNMALATSEFNKLDWVSPYLLKALFIVMAFSTAGWLIWEMMHAGKLKDTSQAIDDIFHEFRGGEIVPVGKIRPFLPWRNQDVI